MPAPLSPVAAGAPAANAAAMAAPKPSPATNQGIFFGETAGPGPQHDAGPALGVIQKYNPVFQALGAKTSIRGASAIDLKFDNSVQSTLAQIAVKNAIDGVDLTFSATKMLMTRVDTSPRGYASFLDQAKLPGVSSVQAANDNKSLMVLLAGSGGGKMGGVAKGADLTEAVLNNPMGDYPVHFEAL